MNKQREYIREYILKYTGIRSHRTGHDYEFKDLEERERITVDLLLLGCHRLEDKYDNVQKVYYGDDLVIGVLSLYQLV